MNDFVIEKDIPLPGDRRANSKYPLDRMVVGDSFLISVEHVLSARMAIQRFKQVDSQAKFATRKDGNGMRVFRVA